MEPTKTDITKINPLFGTKKLNALGIQTVAEIRLDFETLLCQLHNRLGTSGREVAIVRTKLEEACMYAVKAVSLDPRYQEVA